MILYTNGDSHTAGAEAANPCAFAEDDSRFIHLGRLPHPENVKVAWPAKLGELLKMTVFNHAESASSNDRIIRTTRNWLDQTQHNKIFAIIQWSTWERKEWYYQDRYYQITASGTDSVPDDLQEQYKKFIADVDWGKEVRESHEKIWQFHLELQDRKIPHLFFNGNWIFKSDWIKPEHQKSWGNSYLGPYDQSLTFSDWLKLQGFRTVNPKSWHFGKDAHQKWAQHVLQYMHHNKMVPS